MKTQCAGAAAATVASLLTTAFGAQVSVASSLALDLQQGKNRPVSKVITLLKSMLTQLEKDAEEDEEIYDKLACWCETNDKDKAKAITDAQKRIKDLTHKIAEYSALSARLGTEIGHLSNEVGANQKALDEATELRKKQLAEFNEENKDVLLSIQSLKQALVVLSKHNEASFLQVSRKHAVEVANNLQRAMAVHAPLLEGVLQPSQRKLALSFIQQQTGDYFDAEPTFSQSYAPQSGQIFGILRQMKETFEKNMADSQKEENENAKAYAELKVAKEDEIKAGQDQVDSKTQELADTDEKKAQAKTDISDTKTSLGADEEFLMMLKEKCQMTDKEWEARQKTRQDEMEAVSKALSVLSGDEAHDLFTRTFNPSFVQTSATSALRERASRVLSVTAGKWRSRQLASLAYQVKLDAFTKVKKAINDLVKELETQSADEIKKRDFCKDELNSNKQQTIEKTEDRKDLKANIEDLDMKIKDLTKAIVGLQKEIKEMQVQLKKAGEDREKENVEFQKTISDQRATQKLLKAALVVLQDFYGKKEGGAALDQQPAGPPPPPGFEEYKKNAASGGVMGMLKQIIDDAKAMVAEATRAEDEGQKAYEDFVKETNASVDAKSKDIVEKKGVKAKSEAALVEAKKEMESLNLEIEKLGNTATELHQDCDFVLKNFDVRQTARAEEVEALRQALAILSGAKF